MSFHGTALRAEGVSDDHIQAAREYDAEGAGLSPKEQGLFYFALKANGDPHSVTPEDVQRLRTQHVEDAELVETLEITNLGNSLNLFCDALRIGPDEFLTYATDEGPGASVSAGGNQ